MHLQMHRLDGAYYEGEPIIKSLLTLGVPPLFSTIDLSTYIGDVPIFKS